MEMLITAEEARSIAEEALRKQKADQEKAMEIRKQAVDAYFGTSDIEDEIRNAASKGSNSLVLTDDFFRGKITAILSKKSKASLADNGLGSVDCEYISKKMGELLAREDKDPMKTFSLAVSGAKWIITWSLPTW
jgi:hypothetical protein